MVEHNLAKVGVASSTLVSRSIFRRRSQVAKAEVCKTSIHRFDSDRRLSEKTIYAGVAELADARDLKSLGYLYPCRFDSGPRHQRKSNRWELWEERSQIYYDTLFSFKMNQSGD